MPICLSPLPLLAQQAPQVTPRDLRPEVPAKPPASLPQPAPAVAPQKAQTLFVQPGDIVIEDGFPTLAGASEKLAATMRGRRVAVADFYQLAEAIEALYRDAGFALVRVTVPPQRINDGGTLKLLVVDGFIESVDVSAVAVRARGQVESMMRPVVGRRHLRSDDLERALTLAGRGPGLSLRSTLQAGKSTGGVVLVLEAQQTLATATLAADNRLSDALGPWQTNVQGSLNQLFGLGEQLYVNASSGAAIHTAYRGIARRRVLGVGLIVPLADNGLSLNAEYTTSNSAPTALPFTPVTRSSFQRYTTRLTYPLILNRQQELTLTGTLDATSQLDTLPDFQLTLDHDRLRVARVGAAWSRTTDAQARLGAGATLSKGSNGLGARTQTDAAASGTALSRLGANPGFVKLEANLSFETAIGLGMQSRLSLRAQKSLNGVLPGAELFSLDGDDALSAFTSGSLSDDGGATLRQELSRPIAIDFERGALTLAPYAFAAGGKSFSKLEAARGVSSAYGVGLRSAWGGASLALEYGRRQSHPDNLNGNQLFVKAQVQF